MQRTRASYFQVLNCNTSHLNLNMQTGAFLQLVLTFSAIVSRMDALILELRPTVEACGAALLRAVEVLDVRLH